MKYSLLHKDPRSGARAGEMVTGHGIVRTPVFMPVGTVGSVKAVHLADLEEDVKAQVLLGNTYHLYLRPGTEVIREAGGLHKFTGWKRPMLTDSGGYQIFSLAENRKLTPDGVIFQSHIDGSRHEFTPEFAIDLQRIIGADFIMAFDECTPYPCTYEYAKDSMTLTHNWLRRCFDRFSSTSDIYDYSQSLFPIVQGSTFSDLRTQSAEYVAGFGADGNAIGGLSVGEPEEKMYEMTSHVCDILPADKPRYLMGVGTPANLLECISLGIDMFDCVIPTRNGRNGWIYTRSGILNMKNEKWKNDFSPLDEEGDSHIDQTCSRAYLRHLFVSGEILAPMIASLHNLRFFLKLMEEARENIINGTFTSWKDKIMPGLRAKL